MFEEILRMLFWGVVEVILFRLGRFYLFLISLGRLQVDSKRPANVFLVALFGACLTALAIWALVSLVP